MLIFMKNVLFIYLFIYLSIYSISVLIIIFSIPFSLLSRGGWYSLYTILASKVLGWGATSSNVFAFIMCILFWNIPFYFFVFWRRRATEEKTRRMVKETSSEKEMEMKSEIEMSDVKPIEANNNDNFLDKSESEVVVATHEVVKTTME